MSKSSGDDRLEILPLNAASKPIRFEVPSAAVWAVSFLPGDREIVAALQTAEKKFCLATGLVEQGQLIRRTQEMDGLYAELALVNNKGEVAVIGWRRVVHVFERTNWQLRHQLAARGYVDRFISASADGRLLATASTRAAVWDLASGQRKDKLDTHGDAVFEVEVLDGTGVCVSASSDGTLRYWNLEDGSLLRTIRILDAGITALAVPPFGEFLATGSTDGFVELRDADTGRLLKRFSAHNGQLVAALRFTAAGELISAGADGFVRVWNASQNLLWWIQTDQALMHLDIAPDRSLLAYSNIYQDLHVWHVNSKEQLMVIPMTSNSVGVPVAFSPDSNHLSTMTAQQGPLQFEPLADQHLPTFHSFQLLIFDLQKTQPYRTVAVDGMISCCTYSADGEYLAAGITTGFDSDVVVWSVRDGRQLARFSGHRQLVHDIAFLADNKGLVSASEDSTLLIWRFE